MSGSIVSWYYGHILYVTGWWGCGDFVSTSTNPRLCLRRSAGPLKNKANPGLIDFLPISSLFGSFPFLSLKTNSHQTLMEPLKMLWKRTQCYVDIAATGKAETTEIEEVHFCRSGKGEHGQDEDENENETMQDNAIQDATRQEKVTRDITRPKHTKQDNKKRK